MLDTTKARIRLVSKTSGMFLRVLTPANGSDPMSAQSTMLSGQISLLHGTSPIGTKFYETGSDKNSLGPMSAPNVGQGRYDGSFWLGFNANAELVNVAEIKIETGTPGEEK